MSSDQKTTIMNILDLPDEILLNILRMAPQLGTVYHKFFMKILTLEQMNIYKVRFPCVGDINVVQIDNQNIIFEYTKCSFDESTVATQPAIKCDSYMNYSELRSVTFNRKLSIIDEWSFINCKNLRIVSFLNCEVSFVIGPHAFSNLIVLRTVEFGNSVTHIGDYAFSKCPALTNINLSNCTSLTKIGDYAFSDTSNLKQVNFCESINSLGNGAFARSGIEYVDLSRCKIVCIAENTFKACDKLTYVKICQTLKCIFDSFRICRNLKIVDLNHCSNLFIRNNTFDPCWFSDLGLPYNGQLPCLINMGEQTNVLSKFIVLVPEVLRSALQSGVVESTIAMQTVIEYESYRYCLELRTVTFNRILRSVGENSFSHCKNLAFVSFLNCTDRFVIGNYAFSNLIVLRTVEFGNSVTHIGKFAFSNCPCLKMIDFSDCGFLTTIEESAFSDTPMLQKVTFCASLKHIGPRVFLRSGVTNIDLSNCKIECIDEMSFSVCKELCSVKISPTTREIGHAFRLCPKLIDIDLMNCDYLMIREYAFQQENRSYTTYLRNVGANSTILSKSYDFSLLQIRSELSVMQQNVRF